MASQPVVHTREREREKKGRAELHPRVGTWLEKRCCPNLSFGRKTYREIWGLTRGRTRTQVPNLCFRKISIVQLAYIHSCHPLSPYIKSLFGKSEVKFTFNHPRALLLRFGVLGMRSDMTDSASFCFYLILRNVGFRNT